MRALILTPTRELATQIADSFRAYGRHMGLRTAVIFGGVGQQPQVDALRRGIDILVATPGRLLDLKEQGHVRFDGLSVFVLDEADRMLDMGFIHDVRRIAGALPKQRQSLLFSATMPPEIERLVGNLLKDPVRIEVTPSATTVELIDQRVMFVDTGNNRAQINVPVGGIIVQGPLPTSGTGGTNFYDAVYLAAHDKLSGEAGRKAIVVLTDAEDTGSRLRLTDAIEAAQRTDTVVHILLVAADGGDRDVAGRLTGETGGRMIVVRSEKNLEQAFDEISEELRSQYTIGYTPTNKKHDGSYRKIKVETKDKDYSVLTRRGYYAPND
jgi:VWFA-related protein